MPFDTDTDIEFTKGTLRHSEYHKILSKHFKVIVSHIFTGQDIFQYEPKEEYDCIVSNPPFRGKSKIVSRVLEFNKPFMLLQPFAIFNDRNPIGLISDQGKQVQILKFNQRAKFIKPSGLIEQKVTFQSGYICYDILENDFIVENLVMPTPKDIREYNKKIEGK